MLIEGNPGEILLSSFLHSRYVAGQTHLRQYILRWELKLRNLLSELTHCYPNDLLAAKHFLKRYVPRVTADTRFLVLTSFKHRRTSEQLLQSINRSKTNPKASHTQ